MRFSFGKKLSTTLALQLFQVFRMGSAVLTGILLAKCGLSTAQIGTWEMLLYLGSTFTFFWVNGLLQGIAPTYAKLDENNRRVFIFNNFLLFCGISFLLFIALIVGESSIASMLTGLPEVPYFKLYCWYLLFNLPTFPVEYIYLLQERPKRIVAWGAVVFSLHLVALFLPIWLGYGLGGGVWALVVLSAFKFLWTLRLTLQHGKTTLDTKLIYGFIIFCAPLMLSSVVSNLMLLFDNWLVGWHYQDAAIFAIYRYGAREFPLAVALVSALGTSMIPILTASPELGMAETKAKSRRLMHLLFPWTILLLCTSSWLFPRVFNPNFAASAPLFNIYLMTIASRVLLPTPIMLAKGDSRSIFKITVAEMLLKVLLGFWFIQWWGLPGLAWSVVISFWVEKLGLIIILERRHQVRTYDWLDMRWYLGYVLALVVSFWFLA